MFDIPRELLPSFYEREEEFRIIEVAFQERDGRPGGVVRRMHIRGLTMWVVATLNIDCAVVRGTVVALAGIDVYPVDGRRVHRCKVGSCRRKRICLDGTQRSLRTEYFSRV